MKTSRRLRLEIENLGEEHISKRKQNFRTESYSFNLKEYNESQTNSN